ncbi:MAG: gliding motility-associated C-terminal domain-containing protein [Saprospiraceae bacterium]|nr:gliding motility-associated C-terminal domain-containing protein [Saprospiraceae bacterium]
MSNWLARNTILLFLGLLPCFSTAQITFEVTINGATANTTCTDVFGTPDIFWRAEVNYQGYVTYPMAGGCYTNPPNVQYSEDFLCSSDVPATMDVCFRVFENDNILPCDIVSSCQETICQTFAVPATGSTNYTLSLPGGLSSSGTLDFTFSVSGMGIDAPNDAICSPIDLGLLTQGSSLGDATMSNYNNHCATAANEPNPGDSGANWNNSTGVWFTFTTGPNVLPYADFQVISDPQNFGDPVNLQVALYTSADGTCNTAMTMISEQYENSSYDEVFQLNCLLPNTTYFLLIDGAAFTPDQAVGLFGIGIDAYDVIEGGDLKCDAEDLGTVPDGGMVSTPAPRSNQCAGNFGDPFVSAFVSQKSVWFSFIPPTSGHVLIQAISDLPPPAGYNTIDLQLALYRSNTNLCTGFFFEQESVYTIADLNESMEVSCLDPTRPYWILIDGAGNDTEGIFVITVTDLGDDTPVFNQDITICDGDNFSVGSSIYSATGMYSDTLALSGGCDSIVNTNLTVLNPVVASFDVVSFATNIGVADGEVMGSASGGTGVYTYLWSDGQMGAFANGLTGDANYCLTVTDDLGCSDDTCFVMPYSTVPIPTITGDMLDCFGDMDGLIELVVFNGQPPYNYNWANTGNTLSGNGVIAQEGDLTQVPGLPAGDYSFTITDGVNDTIVSVAITQPTELTINLLNLIDASCFGDCDGQIEVEALGGTPPYAFNWNSGSTSALLSNLCAGNYSLTLTDANSCIAQMTYTINQPPEFIVTATLLNPVSCFNGADGSVMVSTNGTPIDYDWDNGGMTAVLTDLTSGTYSVLVTNADGCQGSASIVVPQPASPVGVSVNIIQDITCFDAADAIVEAVPSGPGSSFTYSWSGNSSTSSTSAGYGPGAYSVTISNEFGCSATTSFNLSQPDEIQVALTTEGVTCLTAEDAGEVAVVSISGGVEPYMYAVDGDLFVSDTFFTGLTAGLYELSVEDANGCIRAFDFEIEGPPDLYVDLGPDLSITLGDVVNLDAASTNNDDLIYTWLIPGLPYDCLIDDCSEIQLVPVGDVTLLTVTVFDTITLCTATDAIQIEVNKIRQVYTPNAFSPNFDGINDVFTVYGGKAVNQVKNLQVFDRYGSLMFRAQNFPAGDEANGWDGLVGGKMAQSGIYVYVAEVEFIDGVVEVVKGDVLLIN